MLCELRYKAVCTGSIAKSLWVVKGGDEKGQCDGKGRAFICYAGIQYIMNP